MGEVSLGVRMLGPDGVLAQNLPGYEARQPQMDMADLCEQVLRDQGQALIEAGTGTGKSFAYLLAALESNQRVVISTESIQLQEQLVRKDLPFLEKALGRPINFAIAKGRGNYFCERNTLALIQEETSRLEGTGGDPAQLDYARQLVAAFADDWDGNKATLTVTIPDLLWSDYAGDDACTGPRCPYAADCAYLKAKEKLEQADLIIANHHYALLHHYVKERSAGVINLLPEHRVWIADEAHTLSDIAQNVFGVELRQGQPKRFVTKLLRQLKALKVELGTQCDVSLIEARADAFFDCFRQTLKDEQILEEYGTEILAEARQRGEILCEALQPVITGLNRLGRALCDPETQRALSMLRMQANGLVDAVRGFFRDPTVSCQTCAGTGTDEAADDVCEACDGSGSLADPDPPVLYSEVTTRSRDRNGKKHVTLHSKPIETRRIFKGIYEALDTAIFCSATLTVGGSFANIAEELGLNAFDIETLQAKSPFDYARQVRGYFPKSVPERKSPEYHDRLADEVLRIVEWTEGRAFILFTANRDMRAVYERIWQACTYPVLMQGEMPKELLLQEFRARPSVLLGVRTFWTGVDIPGDMLSCVALVAFPFPQPEAPLVKARCQRIEARGRRSFDVYSLPRVIRDVQQGFGRLIRSRADRGLFVILDSRWHTARYASTIKRSLPSFPISDAFPTDWQLEPPTLAIAAGDPECNHGWETDGTCVFCDAIHPDVQKGAAHGIQPTDREASEFRDRDPFADEELVPGELATSVAGDNHEPAARPGARDHEVVRPAAASTGVHDRSIAGARSGTAAGDRGADEFTLELSGGGDCGRVAATAPDPVTTPGADGCDPPGSPETGPAELGASPRWIYLRAWVDATYLNAGPGTGSLCEMLTVAEKSEARAGWQSLWKQHQRRSERNTWLAQNPDAGPELVEKSARTDRRFVEMLLALAEWAEIDGTWLCDLLAQVDEYCLEQKTLAEERAEAVREPELMRVRQAA